MRLSFRFRLLQQWRADCRDRAVYSGIILVWSYPHSLLQYPFLFNYRPPPLLDCEHGTRVHLLVSSLRSSPHTATSPPPRQVALRSVPQSLLGYMSDLAGSATHTALRLVAVSYFRVLFGPQIPKIAFTNLKPYSFEWRCHGQICSCPARR